MSKKISKLSTKDLLKKILSTSRERYYARLSLGETLQKNPKTRKDSRRRETKIKNLNQTISAYNKSFESAYDELLRRGIPRDRIDDNLFYNYECEE